MIGLGTWSAKLDTNLIKDTVIAKIEDDNGKYKFTTGFNDIVDYSPRVESVEENGNNLIIKVKTRLYLRGSTVVFNITFEEDTVKGYIDMPIVGKIHIAEGHRILNS